MKNRRVYLYFKKKIREKSVIILLNDLEKMIFNEMREVLGY